MRLVHSTPEFFAHAGDAPVKSGEGFGCVCGECNREISAPFGFERQLIWCLYCGMDKGYVVPIDSPWSHHKYSFGITRDEAVEESAWLALGPGSFEKMSERRARQLGHIIELFG